MPVATRGRSGRVPAPGFRPLCLAEAGAPLAGDDWLHEIKFDGYRVQVHIDGARARSRRDVRILTRSGLDWTARFADLSRTMAELGLPPAILDGEAVVYDADGRSDFGALQEALKTGAGQVIDLMAFDLLACEGQDLAALPLLERKTRLERLLRAAGDARVGTRVRYVDHVIGRGHDTWTEACRLGLEGIVSKRVDSAYRAGRTGDWIKVRCTASDEFVVVGYVAEKGARERVGSLVLGWYDGTRLVHAGRVGTGFTLTEAHALWEGLEAIRAARPAFRSRIAAADARDVRWVHPRLVVQVAYRELTAGGLVRQARFVALRADKPAREVGPPAGAATAAR